MNSLPVRALSARLLLITRTSLWHLAAVLAGGGAVFILVALLAGQVVAALFGLTIVLVLAELARCLWPTSRLPYKLRRWALLAAGFTLLIWGIAAFGFPLGLLFFTAGSVVAALALFRSRSRRRPPSGSMNT